MRGGTYPTASRLCSRSMKCEMLYLSLDRYIIIFNVSSCSVLSRDHRAALWGGEDLDRGNGGVNHQEELPRAVHQRRQRSTVEVSISGGLMWSD